MQRGLISKLFPIFITTALLWPSIGHGRPFVASYYSHASLIREGTRKASEPQIMANGKPFNENAMTCASRDYPLGTKLRVTNKATKQSIVVVVTDRISKRFKGIRVDLSRGAFIKLSPLSKGVIFVDIDIVL